MLRDLLQLLKSTVFLAVAATLAAVTASGLLYLTWKHMGLRYFLLALGGVLLCIMLIVAIILLWKVLERRRADRMEEALTQDAQARAQQRQQVKVAVAGIKERWSEAMLTLKETKVRLYDLPWILLIGEPQSGKTTTLRESGLDFPLGKEALSGAGGTVNCDWWFTNEAVILDTAGRFTMPVDTAPDKEEWQSFLKLLARHRPRCPINGVIVTIPATSLLQDSPEAIKQKALSIREKLQELVATLGVEFPVNIMVSKLDLVYGFAEFCASLSAEERRQALGFNRRNMNPEPFNQDEFAIFFAALVDRLDAWGKRRLRDLPPGAEADRVYAFPGEFNRLKEALSGYLTLIFQPDRYHVALLFRGVFFSSGLQEGRSIARALLQGSEGSGDGRLAQFAQSFVQSRAYFIHAFYTRVFKERWLVRRTGGVTRREILLRLGAAGFALLFMAVAAGLLISGYHTLATKVKPLETQALNARALLSTLPGQETPASRITQAITTLEIGRQDLLAHGAGLFLRGRHNALVEDIGRIEDALVERRLLDKLVSAAGRQFDDEHPITTLEEKQRLTQLLRICIDLYAGKQVTVETLKPLLEVISWKSTPEIDIDRAEIERILQGYPYAQGTDQSVRTLAGGELYIRQMLGQLYRFWSTFYAQAWKEQQQQLAAINTEYQALLTFDPTLSVNRNEVVGEPFSRLAEAFLNAIAELDAQGTGKVMVWSEQVYTQCATEYAAFEQQLAGAVAASIRQMESTARRHDQVCGQLKRDIGVQWVLALEENSHILATDGTLNPEMFLIRDGVVKAAAFGPLFTTELHKRLQTERENPLPLLNAMNQSWQAARDERLKEITGDTDKVSHRNWKKKSFLSLADSFTAASLLQAHQEAAMAAVHVVLPKESLLSTAQDQEVPSSLRASWLAPRFTVLMKVNDWLQSLHPGSIGLVRLREATSTVMATGWGNCVRFWNGELEGLHITGNILKTSSWPAFRREALARHSLFIDRSTWPLNGFFEHMAQKDLAEILAQLNRLGGGSLLESTLQPAEQRVVHTAAIYSPEKYLGRLEEAQRSFNNVLENLTDDPRVSWQLVKSGKPGDNVSLDKFMVLSDFYQRVSGDPAGGDEPLAVQLAQIDTHGAELLKKGFIANSGREWGGFIATWRKRMGNRYPFGWRSSWVSSDTSANEVRKLVLATQSKNDLFDFFFAPEKGLEAFIQKYNLLNTTPGSPEPAIQLSRAQRTFIEHSLAWRDFLFDPGRQPRRHQLRVTLNDQPGQGNRDAEKYFTQLTINGLEPGNTLRLRFSGQRYKSGSATWEIGRSPEILFEARNEETGLTSIVRLVGGGLTFPGYTAWKSDRSGRSGEVSLSMLFPQTGGAANAATYVVPISVAWDQQLPSPLTWPGR